MQEKTLKILVAVLRVFIGSADRGNPITLHEHEVVSQVCRGMHKRKEKEVKNMRGLIVFAIRSLKGGCVLYEAIDSWSDDKLKRPKSSSEKKLFGLTDKALTYVAEHQIAGVNTQSNQFLLDMLRAEEFEILPKNQIPITVDSAPEALVKTVTAIKQEQKQEIAIVPDRSQPARPETAHNVQRLVVTVRNKSKEWLGQSTPADLLGGLSEQYFATEGADTAVGSAVKLGWPERRRAMYKEAVRFLKSHGLVEDFDTRRDPYTGATRAYGVKLTNLGLEVAVAGEFKDERPQSERKVDAPTAAEKLTSTGSPMLKGHKKPDETPAVASDQLAAVLAQMQKMREEITALRAEREVAAAGALIASSSPPEPTYYNDRATMAVVLKGAVAALIQTFSCLLDDKAQTINATGLYLSLTEFEKAVLGIKGYVSECIRDEAPVDLELLQQYAADYTAAADMLETKSTLPIVAEKIVTKRSLAGDNAIRRQIWRRDRAAQV